MRNRTKGAKRTADERYGEEHLSGAYIRSLVKQLTASSKPKQEEESSSGICDTSSAKFGGVFGDAPQSQQVKKQVRRRAHTNKPYQERLLNMAEARKEIVTALKYHRAAMRQAQSEGNQREPQENCIVSPGTANFTFPNIGLPPSHLFPWVPPSVDSAAQPDLNPASETLGLNLNFHNFGTPSMGFFEGGSDTGFKDNPISVPNCSSSSSTSFLGNQNCIGVAPTATVPTVADPSNAFISPLPMSSDSVCHDAGAALHPVLDEEEMVEIRSLGEQHQMEWNDTMNLVSSAWWFNFLNNLEIREEGTPGKVDGPIFDEFMEIPSRWNGGVDNLDVATIASPGDEYEDFLQDMSFEW